MQNIGITFIKTGQYSDAINSFEHIMSMAPNLKAGFNLILSCFAIGDREKMKKAFQKLIAVPLEIDEDDKYISPSVSMRMAVTWLFCCLSLETSKWECLEFPNRQLTYFICYLF